MIIDSHHHFWNYSESEYEWISDEMAVLKRDFLPKSLSEISEASGVDGFISVQARQSVEETSWLLNLAESSDLIKGIVGWLPLSDQSLQQELERFARFKKLKGVRHVIQDEPDDHFILGGDFNQGIKSLQDYGLVYDILIFAKHLPQTIQFVDNHPEQLFVLDHIAKPKISSKEVDSSWQKWMKSLAERENVVCKFSGVVTEVSQNEWNAEMLRPWWDSTLEAFGTERLLYGSDWPVCLLKSGYQQWIETVRGFVKELSSSEQADIMGENAVRTYKI